MVSHQPTTASAVVRPRLLPVLKGCAALFAALVLVQALLAGRGWFLDRDLIEVHGGVGGLVVLVAVAQAILAFAVGPPAEARRAVGFASGAILVLTVLQYVLGFATEDSANAAAWHVPNGVLIFGMAIANNALVLRLRS